MLKPDPAHIAAMPFDARSLEAPARGPARSFTHLHGITLSTQTAAAIVR